jgi:hypothetical protein
MHDQDELNRLAVDIVQNGLRHPIITTPDGQVLDGRNRLAACELVSVEPTFEVYDGDPWAYSRSVNLHVRNMTTGQKAASCAVSLIAQGKRHPGELIDGDWKAGRWARGSVPGDDDGGIRESTNTQRWRDAMSQAGFVADWSNDDMDLLASVRDGRMALDAAYKKAKARMDKAVWDAEQERKARESEIAANDAEFARLLSLAHNQLQLDLGLIKQAQDPDNWRGVSTLAPKIIKLWTQLKEQADAELED